MKGIMYEKGKNFSKFYFKTEKKIKKLANKFIQSKLEEEKIYYIKKYHKEPTEIELKIMKKEIVMRYGSIAYLLVFILILLLYYIK